MFVGFGRSQYLPVQCQNLWLEWITSAMKRCVNVRGLARLRHVRGFDKWKLHFGPSPGICRTEHEEVQKKSA